MTSIKLSRIGFNWYSPGIRAQLYDTKTSNLENDIVITKDKPFDLMANIPLEVDEIEDLMN